MPLNPPQDVVGIIIDRLVTGQHHVEYRLGMGNQVAGNLDRCRNGLLPNAPAAAMFHAVQHGRQSQRRAGQLRAPVPHSFQLAAVAEHCLNLSFPVAE